MNRFICIHGHFYQPPRENPWTGEIARQEDAYPYHDWNDKIAAECYTPNTRARILGPGGKVITVVNNYSQMSFDFGPTLLSWLERYKPETYRTIIETDRAGQQRYSGHGPAMAQCYNHMIMPLANSRDKRTQVVWGVRDFEHRFGRKSEGMWLPETAVDLETLDIMAEQGITFTILAPRQAKRIRSIGGKTWTDVCGERIDSRVPYLCRLPSGRTITLLFYDGPLARDIAFGRLLDDGVMFAQRLVGLGDGDMTRTAAVRDRVPGHVSSLAHIATDGETYGHHHRFGEMGLAYCIYHIQKNRLATVTIYGEYLERHPPTREVEVIENSSWSCAHGVERWRDNCGDNTGAHPDWTQAWRRPLREALDWLRDRLIPFYEEQMRGYVKDPWQVRDDYIAVVLDRSEPSVERFGEQRLAAGGPRLAPEDEVRILRRLEMQHHAMLMYTSCGWFFDDVSGIETIQILQYAARAMQLAREVGGPDLEAEFIARLEPAPGNKPEYNNGARAYEKLVKPS
jgi:alpha-amylase/alpha-mannosidase (GH57 family)